MASRGCARVGCSGWEYKHWRGDFYPPDVPRSRWFEHYAATFDTVEINNTFYRLPEERTFAGWAERAPARFLFAVKASRFLTHMKKLKDPEEPLDRLFTRMRPLDGHLGPVLYQLPPGWTCDAVRLEHFLRFRVALCLHDMRGSATGHERVGPFVYVRFHGATGNYGGGYSDARLARWAEWLEAQRAADTDVYAYFNNDIGGHAPRNAVTLRRLMGEQR
jgi:uncharacterized protein YecE (DUF72 family)